ncbi:MAG: fibronectin type III domain-containing protein [Treponema sp.]|jgi:hypothetical protein|nr:fibronectin type III domain-containing protein [Treponema sp.]
MNKKSLYFGIVAFVVAMSLVFTACKDEDEDKKDETAPTLPATQTLSVTASTVTDSGFTVTWAKASDDVTTAANLKYFVYTKTSSFNSSTVAVIKTGVLANSGGTKDIAQLAITGLNANTDYWYAVIVADEAGNESAYTVSSTAQKTTKATIAWTGAFTETTGTDNEGKVTGKVIATLSAGATFADAAATLTTGYTVSGTAIPEGLTLVATKVNNTVEFTLTGTATTHNANVTGITIAFTAAAFTSAGNVDDATKTKNDIGIDFTA